MEWTIYKQVASVQIFTHVLLLYLVTLVITLLETKVSEIQNNCMLNKYCVSATK